MFFWEPELQFLAIPRVLFVRWKVCGRWMNTWNIHRTITLTSPKLTPSIPGFFYNRRRREEGGSSPPPPPPPHTQSLTLRIWKLWQWYLEVRWYAWKCILWCPQHPVMRASQCDDVRISERRPSWTAILDYWNSPKTSGLLQNLNGQFGDEILRMLTNFLLRVNGM